MTRQGRYHGFTKIFCVCLLCAIMVGCVQTPLSPSTTPRPTPLAYAPQDDASSIRTMPQIVYFLSSDRLRLKPTLRTIQVLPNSTLVESLLLALLQSPEEPELVSIFPIGTDIYVLEVEQSQNVVTVNLSGRFEQLSAFEQYAARAAIVNTLTELKDIHYVNILVDSKEIPIHYIPELGGLPTGTMSRVSEDIMSSYLQIDSERTRILQQEKLSNARIIRYATLYFSSRDGTMLLPEVREIEMYCDDFATPLLQALARGPGDTSLMKRTMPAGINVQSVSFEELMDGKIMVDINLRTNIFAFIDQTNTTPQMVYASIVRTITTFVPQAVGVRIRIGGRKIQNIEEILLVDDLMTRNTFSTQVGRSVQLYFPTQDGRLQSVVRALPQDTAGLPRVRLEQLLSGMADSENQDPLHLPFPQGFDQGSIIGIAVDGDVALLNLTQQGIDSFQGISAQQERAYVFSMVNTLCQIAGIKRVRFLVEGIPIDSLAGSIYLQESIMPNPGIVMK